MSAVLRAKFLVDSVKKITDRDGNVTQEEIHAGAVYGEGGTANAQWSKWTPSASLNLNISNPEAFDKVRVGQFYFVDLIPWEKDSN